MPPIAIITDTDSSLPGDLVERYQVHLVPMTIPFSEDSYETGVDIDDADTVRRIDREGKLTTTAAPSPEKFIAASELTFTTGTEKILCLFVRREVKGD